jgi:hypothetical protein
MRNEEDGEATVRKREDSKLQRGEYYGDEDAELAYFC